MESHICAFVAAASIFLISVCRHIVFRSRRLRLIQFHSNEMSIIREGCLAQLCSFPFSSLYAQDATKARLANVRLRFANNVEHTHTALVSSNFWSCRTTLRLGGHTGRGRSVLLDDIVHFLPELMFRFDTPATIETVLGATGHCDCHPRGTQCTWHERYVQHLCSIQHFIPDCPESKNDGMDRAMLDGCKQHRNRLDSILCSRMAEM